MEVQGGKFLTFMLGAESFGTPIRKVKEIIGMMEITHIPKTQGYIKGVINLRGKIIPVMDLRLKFGMAEKEYNDRTCIMIMEVFSGQAGQLIGVVVDAVTEVVNIQAGEIEPPPEYGTGIEGDFLTGIGKLKDKVILLLNIEKVLSREEIGLVKKDLTGDFEKEGAFLRAGEACRIS
ncbi:MAG: chemotaxis protein CheW [Bacillota bacterium]